MSEVLETFEDENGDTVLVIPNELSESLGWDVGDTVLFKVLEDGSISLSKKI